MKVLLINGSPRPDGETQYVLSIIESVLCEHGVDVEWFQLDKAPVRGFVH